MVSRMNMLQARTAEATNIFSLTSGSSLQTVSVVLDTDVDKWKKLEKLMGQELSKWWEATALEKYRETKMVPRGLRIYTVPTYGSPNPRLLKDWTCNSEACSMGMMNILIQYAWEEHPELLKQIEAIKDELTKNTPSGEFSTKMTEMETRLKKKEDEIKVRKQRKFLRDQRDYASGRILTFHKKYDHLYSPENKNAMDTLQTTNGTEGIMELPSVSSISESDVSDSDTSRVAAEQNVKSNINFLEDFRVLTEFRNRQARSRGNEGRGPEGRGRGRRRGRGRGGSGEAGKAGNTQTSVGMEMRLRKNKP